MRQFEQLRSTPFKPQFVWVATPGEAADIINRPHEDYPLRVPRTTEVIRAFDAKETQALQEVWSLLIFVELIHKFIFHDTSFAGQLRTVNVRVGEHLAPNAKQVPDLYAQLMRKDCLDSLRGIKDWYWDFETLHPFQDGNGRVGATLVAVASHRLYPRKGWLAALQ